MTAVTDVPGLLDLMAEHVGAGFARQLAGESSRDFAEFGYAKVSFLAPVQVKVAVAAEVNELLATGGVRRDVAFRETDFTPRRMRNVRRAEIAELARLIPALYRARPLLDAMSSIVGEEVQVCPYEPEQYVITCLERDGDTHGWHWDDYRFALVWVIDCPPTEHGGLVECVPNTTWDKTNPEINQAVTRGPVFSLRLGPGDLYVMRTDTTLHRVCPIRRGTRRIINMAYASTHDLIRPLTHETMDGLWSGPCISSQGLSRPAATDGTGVDRPQLGRARSASSRFGGAGSMYSQNSSDRSIVPMIRIEGVLSSFEVAPDIVGIGIGTPCGDAASVGSTGSLCSPQP